MSEPMCALPAFKIGTVTGVELNSDTFRADTTFAVEQGVTIPDDSAVVISSEGLLGGNFVEVMPGRFAVQPRSRAMRSPTPKAR